MKNFVAALLLASSVGSVTAADDSLCSMYGSLARGITEDRDRGIPYDTERSRLKAAAKGLPSNPGLMQISLSALKTSYLDMPKLTPEGAYKLFYAACLAAN